MNWSKYGKTPLLFIIYVSICIIITFAIIFIILFFRRPLRRRQAPGIVAYGQRSKVSVEQSWVDKKRRCSRLERIRIKVWIIQRSNTRLQGPSGSGLFPGKGLCRDFESLVSSMFVAGIGSNPICSEFCYFRLIRLNGFMSFYLII